MRRVGQIRKRDANEREIIDALRAIGVVVFQLSGKGVPDLLCYRLRESWIPIEVKEPHGRLTRAQQVTRRLVPFPVARTVNQALALFGVER